MNQTPFMMRAARTVTLGMALYSLAHAATVNITLDSNFAAPDYAFYTYTDTTGATQSNIPVAPYITYLNGGAYSNTEAYTICYDFNSPTNVGTSYPGSFVVNTDTATMEASYLVNKLNLMGLLNASLGVRGPISMAIWEIMYPSSTTNGTPFPADPAAQPYEVEAANAVANHSWTAADNALYPTWVPSDPSIQRLGTVFSNVSPVSATPEPASLVLIGLGLLGLAALGRKSPSQR
jgi:hypothetical protein